MANLVSRRPIPTDPEDVGSGPCVRHNVTGREILLLNGLEVPCPITSTVLREARLAREAAWAEAVEAIGWE